MSTVDELFDNILERYHKATQRPCGFCNGTGKTQDWGQRSDPILEGEFYVVRFPVVSCSSCNGLGKYDNKSLVFNAMLGEALRFIGVARDDSRFGDMNAALDWILKYMNDVLAKELKNPEAVDALRDFLPKLFDGETQQLGVEVASSALTEEEMKELGL